MLIPMTAAVFFDTFPAVHTRGASFGRWADESDRVHCYYVNAAGQVGEVIYNPADTVSTYNVVDGWEADELKRLYNK